MASPTKELKQLIYRAPDLKLSKRLPFTYLTSKEIYLLISQRRWAQIVKHIMQLQQLVIQAYKGKIRDRRISRLTKKQTGRKMTVKQARAINRGRAKAGLKRINFKVLK